MANATIIVNRPRSFVVGTYAGTTAAQNINIGFKPAALIFWNVTDQDDLNFWVNSEITTFMNVAAAAAKITAAITAVDNGTVCGFSLPSDSDANEDGKTYAFIAFYS